MVVGPLREATLTVSVSGLGVEQAVVATAAAMSARARVLGLKLASDHVSMVRRDPL